MIWAWVVLCGSSALCLLCIAYMLSTARVAATYVVCVSCARVRVPDQGGDLTGLRCGFCDRLTLRRVASKAR